MQQLTRDKTQTQTQLQPLHIGTRKIMIIAQINLFVYQTLYAFIGAWGVLNQTSNDHCCRNFHKKNNEFTVCFLYCPKLE